MIVTKDANKIAILMGLTIMQASKNFKSNKLLRIFRRSNSIFEDPCETHEQLGRNISLVCVRINL